METGIADHVWSVEELVSVALMEPAGEPPQPTLLRLPDAPPGQPAKTTTRPLPNGRGWLRLVKPGPTLPSASSEGAAGPTLKLAPRVPVQLDLFEKAKQQEPPERPKPRSPKLPSDNYISPATTTTSPHR
jgi:hypothetical protein